MSAEVLTKTIEVPSAYLTCDICGARLNPLWDLCIVNAADSPVEDCATERMGEKRFRVRGFPGTEEEVRSVGGGRGWVCQEVYGKTFDICPSCRMKETPTTHMAGEAKSQ